MRVCLFTVKLAFVKYNFNLCVKDERLMRPQTSIRAHVGMEGNLTGCSACKKCITVNSMYLLTGYAHKNHVYAFSHKLKWHYLEENHKHETVINNK